MMQVTQTTSFEDYLAHFAADYFECVEGELIQMAPVSLQHANLTYYLHQLLEIYFTLRPIGRVIAAPFVLKLSAINVSREPDLQVILAENLSNLKETFMDGPAQICIEIVSVESTDRDYGKKFVEYELGGVSEYWIIDPLRRESHFYRLREIDQAMRYAQVNVDENGNYRSPQLPQLIIHVPTLWTDPLPNPLFVMQSVQEMLR